MGSTLTRVTYRFDLDEPTLVARPYRMAGQYEIRFVKYWRDVDGEADGWSFHGIPVTKTGQQNGRVDFRTLADADRDRIIAMVANEHRDLVLGWAER